MLRTTNYKKYILLLASIHSSLTSATYTLTTDYTGANFFKGFDFFTDPDPTAGHVQFLDETAANATSLAGFMNGGNSTMAIYMGVDMTNQAPNGRGAVRVTSNQTFHHALVIADIVHMPTGCGTWPAFWMVGETWPTDGEIDIVEGVNVQTNNSMTLHTGPGVVLDTVHDFTGELQTQNCDVNAPDQAQNAGCSIVDNSNLTFGSSFNDLGGGVFATEWTSSFIKIWFFARGSVPADITSSAPVPSDAWGTPNSVFQGNFSMDEHFKDLRIVFDTTFCGDWAGAVWDADPVCSKLAPTCVDYVTANPGAFGQAFWAVNTLQVFQDDGAGNSTTSSPSTGTGTASGRRARKRDRARVGGTVSPIPELHPNLKRVA